MYVDVYSMFDQYVIMEPTSKPKTVLNTINTILLSWENIFGFNSTCILEIQNDFGEWKYVYRGRKTQFLVEDLTPCSCYNFRIRCSMSNWLYFKSATAIVPYYVMHMIRAIKFGDTSIIRKIITKRPILLETENKEGKTPLIQAVEGQNFQMVSFLVNVGANVNSSTLITQRTPLMVALYHKNLQISSFLIDKGANQRAVDCNKLSGLHHAVDSNIFDNVKFCLNHNFYINAADNKGWTPLLRSIVLECDDEIVEILLDNGADPSIKDKNGFDFYKHLQLKNRTIEPKADQTRTTKINTELIIKT